MAKSESGKQKAALSDKDQVEQYLKNVAPSMVALINQLRVLILSCDKRIDERIKWNAPSFYYTGELISFDAKEYTRDLIVLNLRQKGHLLLVLPTGAKVHDKSGLLEGDYEDGRRLIKIIDIEDLSSKAKALKKIIKDWIKVIDK